MGEGGRGAGRGGHCIFKGGRVVVLERGFRWDPVPRRDPVEWERTTAHCAVRAVAALCEGLIRPMSFGVTCQWLDDEYGFFSGGKPPRWNWFVKTRQAPSRVGSGYVDAQVTEVETLDEPAMFAAVDRALDDPGPVPDGDHRAWEELLVDHTWARPPEPDRHLEGGELRIDDYDNGGRPRIAVERAHGHPWVSAPGLGAWDPFVLRVTKSWGTEHPDGAEHDEFIRMDIHVHWSFWWEPGEGRAMLDRAVDRVLGQGWREAYPRP